MIDASDCDAVNFSDWLHGWCFSGHHSGENLNQGKEKKILQRSVQWNKWSVL